MTATLERRESVSVWERFSAWITTGKEGRQKKNKEHNERTPKPR
jgi:hypothetical protein